MLREFLNNEFIGNLRPSQTTGFRPISANELATTRFDSKYFEATPTVWTSTFAFDRQLEDGDQQAIEEWVSLFILHFHRLLHLTTISGDDLRKNYDKDLWMALSGTYLKPEELADLDEISLLEANDGIVVGAYHPSVIFFPSRGRESWRTSDSLRSYLNEQGDKLSWEKCLRLNDNDQKRRDCYGHLLSVSNLLLNNQHQTNLENFASQEFSGIHIETRTLETLNPHPKNWFPDQILTDEKIRASYPLTKDNINGGKTYYLVNEMPVHTRWMVEAANPGEPAPINFAQPQGNYDILTVKIGNRRRDVQLNPNDKIVLLKSLFLEEPSFCKINNKDGDFVNYTAQVHKVPLRDRTIKASETAVCFAPFSKELLQHFPEVMDANNLRTQLSDDGGVKWTINLNGKEIVWECHHSPKVDLDSKTTLEIFPPKVSLNWKLYAGYGTGERKHGRWHLIDEKGLIGEQVELTEYRYISILHPDQVIQNPEYPENNRSIQRNSPRALLFTDEDKRESGVLLLQNFESHNAEIETAALAVDLGSSNTSLAVGNPDPKVLKFSLKPKHLWGLWNAASQLEIAGSVPHQWGGEKGYFPTNLLSQKKDEALNNSTPDQLRLKDLFKVDIPGLHKGLNEPLLAGTLTRQTDANPNPWDLHKNLKWDPDPNTPWRSLFLELILLYGHAEVFFNHHAKIGSYVFTQPLAFVKRQSESYYRSSNQAIRRIRHYCYGEEISQANYIYRAVDESTAIAKSVQRPEGMQGLLEVFIDIGGGTSDIAIRHENKFYVLDSVKVAGDNFFGMVEKALRESRPGFNELSERLKALLGFDLQNRSPELNLQLGTAYSIKINDLNNETFQSREEKILGKSSSSDSFSAYRSRLFFRHLIAYALLQACATIISKKLSVNQGIDLILGGNGWGLLLFAEWRRNNDFLIEKAEHILNLLKNNLEPFVTDDEKELLHKMRINTVDLLNQNDLSRAKTGVVRGALYEAGEIDYSQTAPFAGINIKGLKINELPPQDIRWCDRWSLETFNEKYGKKEGVEIDAITSRSFVQPQDMSQPIDQTLAVFTSLAGRNVGQDQTPREIWQKMNNQLINCINGMIIEGGELVKRESSNNSDNVVSAVPSNYFLSRVLYRSESDTNFLDKLAELNGTRN